MLNETKEEIPSITNLATTNALTAFGNKIPNSYQKKLKQYKQKD